MKVTIAECEQALRAHVGQVPPAADDLGISPQALRGRISRSQRLQRVQEGITAGISAVAVKALVRRVYQGDLAAARFWLERRDKTNWSARTELVAPGADPFEAALNAMTPEEIVALFEGKKHGGE